ncbi:uncharacterized protein LOC114873707 [Osmia bicornis bicornis]|uniref:uncharacterized protein LOC114873707 n=1 Tax=Osmia bicornis bicornis TaxID=1437191 RepID=UPI0010F7701B|nr:uncharacterized protein LOC114873707 [Osmia bicornis bicornis]
MRSFVPTVCLLIGAIIGSCEFVNSLYVAQPGDENNDMSIDNRDGKTSMDVLEAWKEKEPLVIEEMYEEEIDPNVRATDGRRRNEYLDAMDNAEYNRRINSLANTVSKRREIVESWYDLPRENEEQQDPLPLSQTKKKKKKKTMTTTAMNPWIYRWGNKKRQNVDEGSSSVRRPIRVPFNSWGGKRGEEYSRSAAILFPVKRTKLTTYDRYDRDGSIDGYDVKREATDMDKVRWKTPFNSWGGKRAGKSTDRERYLRLLMERVDNAPIFGVLKEYGFVKGRNNEKGNDNFSNRNLFRIYNKTNEYDSSTTNRVNERLPLMPNKRMKHHEICKRTSRWDPWGGKRSLDTHTSRFGKDVALLAYSLRGNKTFLCCYPLEQPK